MTDFLHSSISQLVAKRYTHTHTQSMDNRPFSNFLSIFSSQVITYTGKRDLETLSKFLDSGGVLPEVKPDEDEEEEQEEDEGGDNADSKVCGFPATSLYVSNKKSLTQSSHNFCLCLRRPMSLHPTKHPKMSCNVSFQPVLINLASSNFPNKTITRLKLLHDYENS